MTNVSYKAANRSNTLCIARFDNAGNDICHRKFAVREVFRGSLMTNDNSIMKFEEVMAYLDIGKSTLYTLLRNGDIQSFKIGKTWKIPRKAVEDYVQKSITRK